MKVWDILYCTDIQSKIRIQEYNYDNDSIKELTAKEASERQIKYIWAEQDKIVIEVEEE